MNFTIVDAYDQLIINILKGNFHRFPEPNSTLIRIFLSSTFTGYIKQLIDFIISVKKVKLIYII